MGNDSVANPPGSPLRQLCERAKIGDEAKALLTDALSTKEFLALLEEKELFRDALRIVAHMLPKREAIGWGCLCVRHILPNPKEKRLPDAQLAAERWVSAPTEENRWAAKQAADSEDRRTPSGMLALAVFFAGPSLAAPHLRPVPPPERMTSKMVGIGVVLSGVVSEPKKAKEKYQVFMQKAKTVMTRMAQTAQH